MITIISGTNRKNSNSRKVAEFYGNLLSLWQVKYQILDLAELPEDFIFSALYENVGKNPLFNNLSSMIATSDKFLFVVSEYNGSFPGVLKGFIDGLSYPNTFRDKKAAMVGISSGSQGGIIAMSHLTDIFNYLGMQVLPQKPRLAYIEKYLEDDRITNKFYIELLEQQVEKLLDF